MTKQPTRRALVAGLAAAPVAALPAVADAFPGLPLSPALAAAIARHRAAWGALNAVDGDDDDEAGRLSSLEDDALAAVAATPCATDAEFVEKLRYMAAHHKELWGPFGAESREILDAIRLHTSGGA